MTSGKQAGRLDGFRARLEREGYILLERRDIPLSDEDFLWLEGLFVLDRSFDLYEPEHYHIKNIDSNCREWKKLNRIFGSRSMLMFYTSLTGIGGYIDLYKLHCMEKGGYIGRHKDCDRSDIGNQTTTVVIQLARDFSGGEFYLYTEGEKRKYKLPYRSMIVFDSFLSHGVDRVESGERKTLAYFLKI